jgi:mono/diheme cytochrome c family protein
MGWGRRTAVVMAFPLVLATSACGPRDPRAPDVLALQGEAARGETLYVTHCASCHQNLSGWPMTLSLYGGEGIVSTVIQGVPNTKMPAFATLTDQQLADLYAYLRTAGD